MTGRENTSTVAYSHGSASVVRATTQVSEEVGNSTPCHAHTP